MGAVGIRPGSVDEGSPPGGRGAGRPHSGRAGIACGRARMPACPLVRGAAGMWLGGDGGGRDVDWQGG
jgi:hypothetical protein